MSPVRNGLRSHAGQPLDLADHSLAVREEAQVLQAGPLLPGDREDLLVTVLLDLMVPHQVQHHPQQGGGGGLRPGLEQVQAGDLQTLLVKVGVGSLHHLHQVDINEVSSGGSGDDNSGDVSPGVVGVQGVPVLGDGVPEHVPELGYDPPPGVEARRVVTDQSPDRQEVLQGKLGFEQSSIEMSHGYNCKVGQGRTCSINPSFSGPWDHPTETSYQPLLSRVY